MSSELQTTGALALPGDQGRRSRLSSVGPNFKKLVVAIRTGDDAMVESAVVSLSQRSRWLAPLAMLVGAFLMLFQRVKLLFTNWRLSLVQILPAMWIWAAMLDLKAHVLHGREFHVLRGPLLIPIIVAIAAITGAAFFLNACSRLPSLARPPISSDELRFSCSDRAPFGSWRYSSYWWPRCSRPEQPVPSRPSR
jgi:hypothetical protein